jgi:hypothetical protein
VLLPDELDVLLWHLKLDKEAFIQKYHTFISDLSMKRRRFAAHLEVLHRIVNDQGEPLLDELLGDILPRIRRQLGTQNNQLATQEEAPTRG